LGDNSDIVNGKMSTFFYILTILTHQVLGGKYSKWIVILQEFNLEFAKSKANKSLVFVELICELPHTNENTEPNHSLLDESMFLISTLESWYGDILLYLQTQHFQPRISRDEWRHIRHNSKQYLIIGDTLYHRGIDTILWCFLTHEEAEHVLNDCHLGACGGHLSGMATTQKILRAGYFWPSILKDCIEVVKKFPPCQIFQKKARTHPTPLHPIVSIIPFSKWGIDFIKCKPTSARGMVILSSLLIILLNGLRLCLHLLMMDELHHFLFSITSSLASESHELL
jgi:hypothetical protein